MLEQAADALNRQDYQTAAKLIAALVEQQPNDDRVQLYAARLQEATNKFDNALEIYRSVLQHAIDPKITTEARQGIQRIEQTQAQIAADALNLAKAGSEANVAPGLLILEPLSPEQKQSVVPRFAKILDLDIYSAKLKLPTRGWRLDRLGAMGELEFYHQQFQQAQIPSFCVSQQHTQQFFIFRVNYFQSFQPQAAIVYTDDLAELRTFEFDWSEVTQLVMGMLPIFEEVVEIDSHNRTYRKPKVLDYVHVCDLQLGNRRSIFRLCSQTYDFCDFKQFITQHRHQQAGERSSRSSGEPTGILNGQRIPLTSRDNWKNLLAKIRECVVEVPIQNDFTPFAETALGFSALLQRINPHLELLRRSDSLWDRAFQLYSTLAMCKK